MNHFLALCFLLNAAPALGAGAGSARLNAVVVDQSGEPVEDAVVFLYEDKGVKHPAPTERYVMDQIDKEFVPRVLPVQVGGVVEFPNKDDIQHQIYSFSKTKSFDVPLYKGKSAPPVTFDQEGVVKVGCNIHDWMRGVILVLPTPYFAKTGADGKTALDAPRGGSAEFAVFHERLKGGVDSTKKKISLGSASAEAKWTLALKKEPKKKAAAAPYK